MPFRLRLPTVFSGLSSAARAHHASFWGVSATGVRTTPWHLDTLRGASLGTASADAPQTPAASR